MGCGGPGIHLDGCQSACTPLSETLVAESLSEFFKNRVLKSVYALHQEYRQGIGARSIARAMRLRDTMLVERALTVLEGEGQIQSTLPGLWKPIKEQICFDTFCDMLDELVQVRDDGERKDFALRVKSYVEDRL